uniref:Beta-defensin-like domain-containing protein n=1 Tax=Serinus canaria TaxID=9135 RepID=A0A8C9NNP4_SERCA
MPLFARCGGAARTNIGQSYQRSAILPVICTEDTGGRGWQRQGEGSSLLQVSGDIPLSQHLLYLVALNLDMKIFSFFFAVLLLILQGTSGFLRAPSTEVQCRQAGGVCSSHHCPPPHRRPFGRCQQGIPCCRTVPYLEQPGRGRREQQRGRRGFS